MAKKAAARKATKAAKASSPKARRARQAPRAGGGGDEMSDYRQKVREERKEEGQKKSGCVPKLFVLVLPFLAAATYLLLRA